MILFNITHLKAWRGEDGAIEAGKFTELHGFGQIWNFGVCGRTPSKLYQLKASQNDRINIFIDRQAAFMALPNPKVATTLIVECREELRILSDRNLLTQIIGTEPNKSIGQ